MLRHEAPFFQLVLQGIHRPLQNTVHSFDGIFVPRRAVQHRFPISRRMFFQRFLQDTVCRPLVKIKPAAAFLLQPPCKFLQYSMEHISHVHRLEPVFLPFLQGKPVLQEMGIRAGGVFLQAAYAAEQHPAIQEPRQLFSKHSSLVMDKCGIHQPFYLFYVLPVLAVNMIKSKKLPFLLFLQKPCGIIPQHIRQAIHSLLFGLYPPPKFALFRPDGRKMRKQLL